jgi:hypothetical protein
MPQLQALKSRHFTVNQKTFECIGTLGTDARDDCIDILRNTATKTIHYVKRSHTMSQNITWLNPQPLQKA